jgi:hypothetical protein
MPFLHHNYPAPEFFDNAVVRNGLADHAQACYGGSIRKSMKAVELAVFQKIVGVTSPLRSLNPVPGEHGARLC